MNPRLILPSNSTSTITGYFEFQRNMYLHFYNELKLFKLDKSVLKVTENDWLLWNSDMWNSLEIQFETVESCDLQQIRSPRCFRILLRFSEEKKKEALVVLVVEEMTLKVQKLQLGCNFFNVNVKTYFNIVKFCNISVLTKILGFLY